MKINNKGLSSNSTKLKPKLLPMNKAKQGKQNQMKKIPKSKKIIQIKLSLETKILKNKVKKISNNRL